jgi:predicted phage terminase large subunit-like protein
MGKAELIQAIEKKKKQNAIKREFHRRRAISKLVDFTTYTKDNYEVNWHHDYMCNKLDKFISGEIKKLMIFVPPQHGKSEIATRRAPAKILGDFPNKKIAICAYNHTVASKFNRDVQRIIDSEEYKSVYPKTNLNGKNIRTTHSWLRNSDEFEIVDHEGSLVSVGVGGALTSRKLDILIVDDIYKDAKEAWSPVTRRNVIDWYNTTAETRLHNDSQTLIVFTRWHEEDLGGYLLKHEPNDWEVVSFPAIKDDNSNVDDPREIGEALWEERHSKTKLLKVKAKDIITFQSLYQQDPKPSEGLLYSRGFKTYGSEKIKEFEELGTPVKSYTDTADKGKDYLCTLIFWEYEKKAYIKDVILTKDDMSVTIPLWAEKHKENKVNLAKIEYNNGGHPFKLYAEDKLRSEFNYHACSIEGFHQSENKEARILSQASWVQDNVLFPENWHIIWSELYNLLHKYMKEAKNENDDPQDTITGVAEMINGNEFRGVINLDDIEDDYPDDYWD